MKKGRKRVLGLCIIVIFVRLAGFAQAAELPDGARGISIAAGITTTQRK